VARAGGIMFASMLLSRLLGMSRDSVMAAQFGYGHASDAYSIAVQIPDLIFMLIAGGGLSSAFMPAFSDFWHKGKEKEAWRMFSVVITVTSLIVCSLVAIVWVLTPWIVGLFGGEKPASVVASATQITRILWPAQIAFIVGSVLQATLFARKQFVAPALAPNIYNLGIILGAILLPRLFGFGIESMAWGGVVGAMLGALVIPGLAVAFSGAHFTPSVDVNAPGVKSFFRLLLPVILGFSLPSVVGLLTQYFGSQFPGDGVNTVLRNSNNLMQAPLGFFGQALALAVFPVLAEYVAKNDMDRYRSQVTTTLRTVIFLGAMSGALMLALAPQISHLLYGWGMARNDEGALNDVALCLRIYALAIPFWCMQPVLMRGFFSLHKTLKPMLIGTGVTALFIALCVAAIHGNAGFLSVPWATNIAATVLAFVLFFALESDVGRLDRNAVVMTFLKSLVAAAAGGAVAFLGSLLAHNASSRLADGGMLLLFGLLGFWTFLGVGKLLKMPETAYLDRVLARFSRKS
jgi:putative peptidoglycan lipid II flippase